MANVKLSELEAGTPTLSDVTLAVYAPGSSPALKQVSLDNLRIAMCNSSPIHFGGIHIYIQADSPGASGVLGDLWNDTDNGILYLCYQNGNYWTKAGGQSG